MEKISIDEMIKRLDKYVKDSDATVVSTALEQTIKGKKRRHQDLSPEDKTLFDCLIKASAMELYALHFYSILQKSMDVGVSDITESLWLVLDSIGSIQQENGVGLQTAFVVSKYKNGEKKDDDL